MRLSERGDGPTVVKIAGLAGGTGLYREEMEFAAKAGFRVAALDTSGDRADDPAPAAPDWDMLATEIVRGLDHLGAERAVLWGTSFGCLIGLATAARHPARIAGLYLAFPPLPGHRPPAYDWIVPRLARSRDPERRTALAVRIGFALLCAWELASPALVVRLPALLRAALEARTPQRTIAAKLDLLVHDPPGFPRDPVPTSIVAGRWDLVAPARNARRLAEALPGSRLRLLAAAGHTAAYARPRTYLRWSVEELRRLTASPRRP